MWISRVLKRRSILLDPTPIDWPRLLTSMQFTGLSNGTFLSKSIPLLGPPLLWSPKLMKMNVQWSRTNLKLGTPTFRSCTLLVLCKSSMLTMISSGLILVLVSSLGIPCTKPASRFGFLLSSKLLKRIGRVFGISMPLFRTLSGMTLCNLLLPSFAPCQRLPLPSRSMLFDAASSGSLPGLRPAWMGCLVVMCLRCLTVILAFFSGSSMSLGLLVPGLSRFLTAMCGRWPRSVTPWLLDIIALSRFFRCGTVLGVLLLPDIGLPNLLMSLTRFCVVMPLDAGRVWSGGMFLNRLKRRTGMKLKLVDFRRTLSKLSMPCLAGQPCFLPSFLGWIRPPWFLGLGPCLDFNGTLLSVVPTPLVCRQSMDFLKDVQWVVSPWWSSPNFSTCGCVLATPCSSQCLTLTIGPSFCAMLITWPRQSMRLIGLLTCCISSWTPRRASPGALMLMAADGSGRLASVCCWALGNWGHMWFTLGSWPTKLPWIASDAWLTSGPNLVLLVVRFGKKSCSSLELLGHVQCMLSPLSLLVNTTSATCALPWCKPLTCRNQVQTPSCRLDLRV